MLDCQIAKLTEFPPVLQQAIAASIPQLSDVDGGHRWRSRFLEMIRGLEEGRVKYRQIEDHLFELKVMRYLRLAAAESTLVYEPKGSDSTGKNCDLLLSTYQQQFLIELKTFHPKAMQMAVPHKYVARNNRIDMDLESYHGFQAVRDHLIDRVLDAEQKFANYETTETVTVVACLLDSHLHLDELQDFVAIYVDGVPRPDDPLGAMTLHRLDSEGLSFSRTIQQFWGFPFDQLGFDLVDQPCHVLPWVHRPLALH